MHPVRRLLSLGPTAALFLVSLAASAQAPSGADLFASVNGTAISAAEYDAYAREAFRQKFYHGKPPEAEVSKMLREVGQSLIDRILVSAAARERNLAADPAAVTAEIDRIEQRYKSDPRWEADREKRLPELTVQIEQKHRNAALEAQVRQVNPTDDEIRAFYRDNPALFTQPARTKASLILIRVDPSSSAAEWEEARKKALAIREQLLGDADFAALAREHSGDATAASGGDLGYLHEGMMGGQVEEALNGLILGETSEPVRVLEGEALLRLDGREPSVLQPFDAVATRARGLLVEWKSNAQWNAFMERLRKQANTLVGPAFKKIMDTPLPDPATPDATGLPSFPVR